MLAREVASYVEELAPLDSALPGDVNGFLFGNPDAEVESICVCWSPTYRVLSLAAGAKCGMIVCHEIPFFYRTETPWFDNRHTSAKLPNIQRFKLLLQHSMCVYRAHSNWDAVPEYGNCDAFGVGLGFTQEVGRGRMSRVYEIAPVTLAKLVDHVKGRLGLDRVRVVGDPGMEISRVGTACGGLGQLFNCPEELWALGAQAGVMGEVLDHTMRHSLELGLPLIETTHVHSEAFGIRNLALLLAERYPDLDVRYLPSGIPWSWR